VTAQAELRRLDREIEASYGKRLGSNLIPVGSRVRDAWEAGDSGWRRRLLALLVDKVVINPSDVTGMAKAQRWHGWVFKPEDIEVAWRH
jgi:hypothetical protein